MLFILLSIAFAAPFNGTSIAEVETYLAQERITKLEDFLPRLSDDTRANFVLMRQSLSLQPTRDPLAPRAILYGRDAKIVYAFNRTSNALEMMENRGDRFEFARLNFEPDGRITKQTNCMMCHGGKPLWGQTRAWPGKYGGDQEVIPTGSLEDRDYRAFLKTAKTDPLYRNLLFKCGTTANGGVVAGHVDTRWPATDVPGCRDPRELSRGDWSLERRLQLPGEGLAHLLNRQNASMLYANIPASPANFELKKQLAATLLGCSGAQKNSVQQETLAHLNIMSLEWRLDLRMNGSFLGNDCETYGAYSPNPACQRGNRGREDFNDGTTTSTDLLSYLALRELTQRDPALRAEVQKSLKMVVDHFNATARRPGFADPKAIAAFTTIVLNDITTPSRAPELIPGFMSDVVFPNVPQWGNGEALCRMLLPKPLFKNFR